MRILFPALLVLLLAQMQFAWAQSEDAPQEAPYVQEDAEFDMLTEPDPGTPVAPTQPKKKTVDLNAPQETENEWTADVMAEKELDLDSEPQPEPAIFPDPVVEPLAQEVKPQPKIRSSNKTAKSAKGGVEYIEHPQAAKGLIQIKKDGTYVYKVEKSGSYNNSGAVRFGTIDPPKITAADGTSYAQMYSGSQQPMLMVDFEWQPFQGYGKLGVQGGLGLMLASGRGRFLSQTLAGQEAKEKYTFVAIPINLGLVYRLEWLDRQWFAPYVSGGGTYVGIAEFRDDGKSPKAIGTPGFYGGGGLLLNVSALSQGTAFTLNSEYGIKNLWVSLDYRYLKTVNEDIDFSSSIIGGGVVVDY